ncbi:MAG: hypothetical protein U1E05_17885, partial [Patescibacteria group bacterium]|nr:hypothetical protein [Patescibacteria group bacterium]
MRCISLGISVLVLLAASMAGIARGATIVPVTSGLHYRYAADSITGLSHGSRVEIWPDDLSGQGRDVAQADETRRPFYITGGLNGLPVVRFTTANQFLHRPGDAFSSATLFVVGMADSRQTGVLLSEYSTDASSGSNDRAWMLMARAGADGDPARDYNRWVANAATGVQSTLDGPDGGALGWNLLAASFSNAGSGYNEFFVNGTSIDSNTTSPRSNGNANLVIGAYQAAGTPPAVTFLRGDIAEIIAFDRVLSTVERRLVENALSAKY